MSTRVRTTRVVATMATLAAFASVAGATILVPAGQRAKLEYSIEIEGKAAASNASGEYQHWSTRRSLTVEATLVAQEASVVDPGEPGGLHRAAKPPATAGFTPSEEMKTLAAEMGKCGDDLACRLRIAERMKRNPQIQADMQKARKAAETIRDSPPRYQLWIADFKEPVKGIAKLDVKREDFFRTAVDEHKTCTEIGEMSAEKAVGPGGFPANFRIDAKDGTFVANIGGPAVIFLAKIDCVSTEGKQRYEEHSQTGIYLLPEKYRDGPVEIENFRGGADAATGGRRLAHGSRELIGTYGTLMDGVPMTARVTIRWTVTLKD